MKFSIKAFCWGLPGSMNRNLTQTYGIDDFTLILLDKAFSEAGEMHYQLVGEVIEDGFFGDTMVINGAIASGAQAVATGLVRLRILNASNTRFTPLSMATGPLTVIA